MHAFSAPLFDLGDFEHASVPGTQVNLGEAVLRGLFSRWIERQPGTKSRGRNGHVGATSGTDRRLGHGGVTSSSSDSDGDDDSESPRSRLTSDASSRNRGAGGAGGTSTGHLHANGGLEMGFCSRGNAAAGLGGGRGIGDDTVLWVTETELGGNGGIQRTLLQRRVGDFDGSEVRCAITAR